MKTGNTWSALTGYQPASSEKSGSRFIHWMSAIANRILHELAEGLVNSAEPQIHQEIDRAGRVSWFAYDPMTEQQFSGSEAEMRSWIEQRYSR